ncbi:glucosaminidase domain-containing protein [Sulfurimonas sp.]
MDYLITVMLIFNGYLSQTQLLKPTYTTDVIPKNMSTKEKKARFLYLILPPTQNVYKELMQRYLKIAADIKNKENKKEIEALKIEYKASSDEDLLARLKPHPVSITLAQAAMESSWATSRFFNEANNVFGIWSINPKDKRIAADEQRAGKVTIWLRKFDTIDDSIRAYYELMSKGKAFKKFRTLRLETDNPFVITQGLDKYSEIGQDYIDEINNVIHHNNFTQYDK